MIKNENGGVPYSVLNQQEKAVEKVVEKSHKNRRRGFAWFLSLVSLLGLGAGARALYEGSDLQYNNEIKSAYVRVIDDLFDVLPNNVVEINGIRFYEPTMAENPAHVEVFATVDENNDRKYLRRHDYFYDLAYDYYQALKTAENSGDFKKYVEILSFCFKEMTLVSNDFCSSTTDFKFNKTEAKKFNNLFNLNEYGLNQVGFLPQYVDYSLNWQGDFSFPSGEESKKNYVTCVVKGLSFVEVGTNEGDQVLPTNLSNAVLNKSLNSKNIKVYETNFEFTYEKSGDMVFDPNEFLTILKFYFAGKELVQNIKVTPTLVREVDLVNLKMQSNKFDFEQNK